MAGEVVTPGVVAAVDVAVVVGLVLVDVVSLVDETGSFEEQPARTAAASTGATSRGRRAVLMGQPYGGVHPGR